MSTTPVSVRTALGCDFSTHAVHIARVSRDAVEHQVAVPLDKLSLSKQVSAIEVALEELAGAGGGLVLLEAPYYGHENPSSALKLSRMQGILETLIVRAGFSIRTMMATEWRPLAGVERFSSKLRPLQRKELKREALRLVRLEYGLETDSDDLAEAILMARVALGIQNREYVIRGS